MDIRIRGTLLVLAAMAASGSCGGREADAGSRGEAADTSAGAEAGEPGMPGMDMPMMGGAESGAMMTEMRERLPTLESAGADAMVAMIPEHRQMVANMIAQMNSEMRAMNMSGDERWNAAVDSLRQDLTRIANMSASELDRMMDAHVGRVRRLMESHESMMRMMAPPR